MIKQLCGLARKPTSLLLLLIASQIAINVVWLRRSNLMVGTDVANHTLFQWEFGQRLQQAMSSSRAGSGAQAKAIYLALFRPPEHGHYYWPPLVYLATLPFTALLGHTPATTCYGVQPFLALLLLSAFLLGRRIADERVGLLAALLISLTPMIFQSARQYAMDLPLTAAVTLCLYLLLRTRGFRDRRWSLILGAALGLAMLVKGQALIFVGPLMILALIVEGRDAAAPASSRGSRLLNLGLCALATLAIAGHWWLALIDSASSGLVEHVADPSKALEGPTGHLGRFSLAVILWHPSTLFFSSLGGAFALACLGGVIVTFGRAMRRRFLLLHVALFLPLVLFSVFFLIKHGRFLMPALPPLLVLAAAGLLALSRRSWRVVGVVVVCAVGALQLCWVSFIWNAQQRESSRWRHVLGGSEYPFAPGQGGMCRERFTRLLPPSATEVGLLLLPDFVDDPAPMVFRLQRDHPQVRVEELVEHFDRFRQHLTHFSHIAVGTSRGCAEQLPAEATLAQWYGMAPGASRTRVAVHLSRFPARYRRLFAELAEERDSFQLTSRLTCREERFGLCIYRRTTPSIHDRAEGRLAGLRLPGPQVNYASAPDHWVPFKVVPGERPPPPYLVSDAGGGSLLRFSCPRPVCRYYLKVKRNLRELRVEERVFLGGSTLWVRAAPTEELQIGVRFRGPGLCLHPHLRYPSGHSSWTKIRPVADRAPEQWLSLTVSQRLPAAATAFGLVLDVESQRDVDLQLLHLALDKSPHSR